MDSLFAQLFLDLQERIKTELPEIEWVEQDFGQDTFDTWRPNVAFPAVLIDFPSAKYSAMGGASQMGTVTVALRLFVAPFTQSYEGAPIEVKEDALQFFELEQKLVRAIHNWMPNEGYCQPFVRERATSSNRNDIGLRIRELQFTTAYDEEF